ncbi:serine/threonine-protein kinase mos [Drosophila tropicalis]|uniref:serine/threonine-protein kinase mos n=1 Tax=Drosophila tropicalis TaxID=46794 RepID=UPI0035ABC66A
MKLKKVSRSYLVLTTPKRKELLEDGPPKPSSDHLLGRGSFGSVFRAIYRENCVAVKIIRSHAMSTLPNELHLLNLRHRNIVRLLKVESTQKDGLLIMECPKGHTLQHILDRLPLPLMHRVIITLDVLAALRYCHSHNILHLDVKPANILVALDTRTFTVRQLSNYKRNYLCKLCDFGSSMEMGQIGEGIGSGNSGTLRYMSPEALRSTTLTAAADVYSLAITMWQLENRQMPYHWLTCNEVIAYQVVKHDLRPDYDYSNAITSSFPIACNCPSSTYKKSRRSLNFGQSNGNDLANHFENCSKYNQLDMEKSYGALYKSCWVSDIELRLNSSQMKSHLEAILFKLAGT